MAPPPRLRLSAASPIWPLRLTACQRDFTHEAGFLGNEKTIRWRETVASFVEASTGK